MIEEAGVEFLSIEDLFARGEQLMTSELPADWKRAFQTPFAAVLKRSPPGDDFGDRSISRQLAVHEASQKVEKDLQIGIPWKRMR